MIWTAAEKYDFEPLFMAYQQNGSPDFYMNSIIGYVHKWYDTKPLTSMFSALETSVFSTLYDGIAWLGLESSTYEKEVKERPLLADLRRDCAEAFFAQEYSKSRQEWMAQNNLLYSLQSARWRTVLGKENRLVNPFARHLYDELNYDASMTAEEISEKTLDILHRYFRFNGSGSSLRRIDRSSFMGRFLSVFSRKKAQYGQVLLPGASGSSCGSVSKAEGDFGESDTVGDYQYIRSCLGEPMYPKIQMEQIDYALCTGHHANCHLYFTRGIYDTGKKQSPQTEKFLGDARAQRKRNLAHYNENRMVYQQAQKRLSDQISNAVLQCAGPFRIPDHRGILDSSAVWKALYLEDGRVFTNLTEEPGPGFSVDLMLDASASRLGVQEIIAAQAYVIASSLEKCHIPVQVYSFCSMRGYTALRLFCGYGETNAKERIFDYFAAGWNRDGLAFRGASHLMESSPCKNKILIILTDASPNDDHRIPADRKEKRPLGENYSEQAAVKDTAVEVQALRRQGIKVMAIINGSPNGQSGARQIYGDHFIHIEKPQQLSRAVGRLLERQIEEYD